VNGPSSAPRGERAGTPGADWETELRSLDEQYVPEGQSEPRPNRAARRAARRAQKGSGGRQTPLSGPSGPQGAREAACTPLSRPNSPERTRSRSDAQIGSQSLDPAPPTRTEPQ